MAFAGPALRVHRIVLAVGAAAGALVAGALLGAPGLELLLRAPLALGRYTWPVTAGFAALLFVLQRQGFVFQWRDQSTKISLDEIGIFLGAVALPPAHLTLAVGAACVASQLAHRREHDKASFNVAQYLVASLAATTLAAALAAAGAPAPWFAAAAPVAFSVTTGLLVSAIFARIEGTRALRVFRTRFASFALVGSALGVSLGFIVYALFALHPLASLAVIPVFAYLRRFGRLTEWADDELKTHRLIASVSAEAAGHAELDRVGDRILQACHELLDCGEASLTLATEPPRLFRARYGESAGFGGVTAEIGGPDGQPLGALSVFPKPGQPRYGEREHQLLRTVASAAAAAATNATALRAVRDAHREILVSERRYRSLFETAPVLIHVVDAEGIVRDANPAALAALGHTHGALVGSPFTDVLPDATLCERLRAGHPVAGHEVRLRATDGRDLCVMVDARVLEDGDERRYVFLSHDITTLKSLEDELRRSMARQHETIKRLENMNRELEEFTLWTTHDMREPLRSIGTIAGFLHEDLGTISTDEARDMARRICGGADRLKERVKALHAFSLIVQRDDEFQDVDMQRVVDEVVSSLETKIAERGARVILPDDDFPTVRAQPHRIHQVLANLVENALKYGRADEPIVHLGFLEGTDEWRFFVRDNGPGIPLAYQERIFQLFQRGPDEQEAGSGAGLAIVKRIAEQHGGRAWVESEPGLGACFFVAVPKPRAHAAPTPARGELVRYAPPAAARKPF